VPARRTTLAGGPFCLCGKIFTFLSGLNDGMMEYWKIGRLDGWMIDEGIEKWNDE